MHENERLVPDLAEDADGISQEVEATYNLVELPQKSADVVALQGVGKLSTNGSDRIVGVPGEKGTFRAAL